MSRPLADIGADAYVWGFPLVTMRRTRAGHGADGRMLIRDRLSTAADRTVVAPNNDTLYSSGWFDLGAGDVVVEVEPMDRPDRYWSVMLLDAYTDVAYVCRRLHGNEGTTVRVVHDPTADPPIEPASAPAAASQGAVVPIATRSMWVLARVLVDGPDDLADARQAQTRIRIRQHGGRRTDGTDVAVSVRRDGTKADRFFADLRAALALDPPGRRHPPAADEVLQWLDDVHDDAVLADARDLGEARIAANGLGPDRHGNGWGTRARGADFGSDVVYRAAFAKYSLAGHLPAENRTYVRALDGSARYELTFPPDGEPPVDAFWSLTVYGPDLFFVPNELNRYSIGDRTSGLRRERDGSLRVQLGHEPPPDTANWLPTPPGRCHLALRCYEGRATVVDATWFPPGLEVMPA